MCLRSVQVVSEPKINYVLIVTPRGVSDTHPKHVREVSDIPKRHFEEVLIVKVEGYQGKFRTNPLKEIWSYIFVNPIHDKTSRRQLIHVTNPT